MKPGVFVVLIGALAVTSCGRSYQGSYLGTETVVNSLSQQTGQTAQSYSQPATLALNDTGSNTVTGTLQAGGSSATFQGQATGSGFTSVTITVSPSAAATQQYAINPYYQPSAYPSSYPGTAYPSTTNPTAATTTGFACSGTFIGNLAITNNHITGSLNAQTQTTCGITAIAIDVAK